MTPVTSTAEPSFTAVGYHCRGIWVLSAPIVADPVRCFPYFGPLPSLCLPTENVGRFLPIWQKVLRRCRPSKIERKPTNADSPFKNWRQISIA
jgi:hypothetical protein